MSLNWTEMRKEIQEWELVWQKNRCSEVLKS